MNQKKIISLRLKDRQNPWLKFITFRGVAVLQLYRGCLIMAA